MVGNTIRFLICFSLLLLAVIGYRFKEYFFEKNFLVATTLPCDPAKHLCFTIECPEDETCERGPYKKIVAPRFQVPECLEERTCQDFTCRPELGCREISCSYLDRMKGEICVGEDN